MNAKNERQITEAPQLAPMVSICTFCESKLKSLSTASMMVSESDELVSVVLMMKPLPLEALEEV